ncbi:hypothetical protein I6I57_13975 [Brevibacterium casei]|uniref:hypothetical protein n=1 Tax=Brevibacterium casei TaxID=33889 RepID=UPI001918A4AF|nr:hypothetical protein [Brevibacterium casei]QQT68798.1 hypothetical protein I6I57_13975 [Brevibacterium casei]
MVAHSTVLVASLASPEPPNSGEARARRPLFLDAGKVCLAVAFGLLRERRGDLGTHPRRFFLDLTKHSGVLLLLDRVCG